MALSVIFTLGVVGSMRVLLEGFLMTVVTLIIRPPMG